jgi:hypothetical protein
LELHRGGRAWRLDCSLFSSGMTTDLQTFLQEIEKSREPATPHQVSHNVGYIYSIITARLSCKKNREHHSSR